MIHKRIRRLSTSLKDSPFVQMALFFLTTFLLTGALIFLFENRINREFSDVVDGFWWAIVTFSTTGYGDKVPVTPAGRLVAVMAIFFGIAATSALSGSLASIFVERNTRARRGLMDFPKLTDHFIICGWKDHMRDILVDILGGSKDLSDDMMVLVSNIESDRIEELKEDPELKGLKFVRGDYFSDTTLKRANVRKARKVLVLADSFESKAASEIDSKTVMTVLTIKAISKDVYTTAELLDRKYESYLKHASCDEIIFSRDFSRQILSRASVTSGMSHIIQDLLASDGGTARLETVAIPREFVGKEYGLYKEGFRAFRDTVLLGVLENTGSPNRMKIEALRDAQKTSDVSALVTNLQKVKGMAVNRPVFIPEDEYMIGPHTMAIILERRGEA
jgi:voltage-gated potassium channel